ncbi:hypothetical protein PQ478_11910 [Alkalihalophilus pseudofirmus]|uniref:hypothetical protein n=1 Tax=Alkalihalophilus pseudofirmus TaxID=79885 RepID=UPI00259B895F|nr:hypothetical protein [Alkalihalophilus pseudofirmus]WEG15245.1 hypothetical protein PQ478_11910 [Alkalihalophilus pseudofirmus]
MLFNKKKAPQQEHEWFSVLIVTETELKDSVRNDIQEEIKYNVDNMAFSGNLVLNDQPKEYTQRFKKDILEKAKIRPVYVIIRVDQDKIDAEIDALNKRHKWKKLFNLIPGYKYQRIYDEMMINPDNVVFSTENVDQAIAFLNSKE